MRIRYPLIATTSVLVVVGALLVASATASGTESPRRPGCTIIGTDGDDRLHGTTSPDVICARAGNDEAYGRGGNDVIYLGAGEDYFSDGAGDDRVYGGPGYDFGRMQRGDDRIFLQGGHDMFLMSTLASGADLVVGGRGRDQLTVREDEGNDRLRGGPGRDTYCADRGDVVRSVEIDQTSDEPLSCAEWWP